MYHTQDGECVRRGQLQPGDIYTLGTHTPWVGEWLGGGCYRCLITHANRRGSGNRRVASAGSTAKCTRFPPESEGYGQIMARIAVLALTETHA